MNTMSKMVDSIIGHSIGDVMGMPTEFYIWDHLDGYFKKWYQELTDEHTSRNYDKAIRWIEKVIIPQFLLDDMNKYIKSKTQINIKEILMIESC